MKDGVKVSSKEAAQIEAKTRAQATSTQWQKLRQWRLTASKFGEIAKITERRNLEKLCDLLYNPPNLTHVPAVRHGNTYESVALEQFSKVTGKKTLKSGLCIHPDFPYLGASPDSFVEGEDAVIECKCPYKGRHSKISPGEEFDFLEESGDCVRLKRNHNYYYQIIGQMKLAQKSHGYFVVYTFKDMFYEKIDYDDAFFNTMHAKLKSFHDEVYCPYIASKL